MRKIVLIVIITIMLSFTTANASETQGEDPQITFDEELQSIQDSQNNSIDYDTIQKTLNQSMQEEYHLDFKELVTKIISGQYDLEGKSILQLLLSTFYQDLRDNMGVVVRIIVISIVAAFFKTLMGSFENKQAAEMGFFVVLLLIIASTIQSYNLINTVADTLINNILSFIQALVPSLVSVTILSGATVSSVMYSESIIMVIGIINGIIKTVMLPFLYILIIFVVLNTISEENSLSRIIALLKKGYEWSMKILLWLLVGIFGLQSLGLPVVDGLLSRTAKQTIGIVPVVGTSISEISDIVLGCGTVIKNAFGIGTIIAIILLAITPIIKILVIALAYKVSAAFIEPISEGRLVTCLSSIGDVCFLLLGTVLLVVFLLIVVIAMTLFITNTLLYIR